MTIISYATILLFAFCMEFLANFKSENTEWMRGYEKVLVIKVLPCIVIDFIFRFLAIEIMYARYKKIKKTSNLVQVHFKIINVER